MSKKTTETYLARIIVYPRPEILDPQGKAIANAFGRLGFDAVTEVRAGKSFEISLESTDEDSAREACEQMADKLLANTVVEDFTVEILGAAS